MTEAIVKLPVGADIERVLLGGDLSQLTPDQRLSYYNAVCSSLGLNPLTRPFQFIMLNGKLQLYAARDCTEQLRKIHGVSITSVDPKQIGDLYVVVASARDANGRIDSSTGAVNIKGLQGENLANKMMTAETKAKRRVTLSLCGLGLLDETEVQTLKDQGVASEPGRNKWEAPNPILPDPTKKPTDGITSGIGNATLDAHALTTSGEPEIRPRSQKGAQPSTQAAAPPPATAQPQQQAVEGEVVSVETAITEKQRKMFFAIGRSANLSDDDVKAALAKVGLHCHRDSIPKSRFQDALRAIDPGYKFHQDKPKE